MAKKERFGTSPTHIKGVQLRREPDVELDILRKTTEEFYDLARKYYTIKCEIDRLDEAKRLGREQILKIAQKTKGLRGLISEKDNFVLTAFPSEKVSYDRDLLRQSLQISYPAIVRETLIVSVFVSAGFVTKKGITISEEILQKTIRKALMGLGISEEELPKVMSQEINIDVNERKLKSMVDKGKVKLESGTRKEKTTWNVKVEP
ncbi:hypothetical protein KAW43_02165 [Candidatus Parcubacteria bacterium]|nr:hypothetical protein [Candidatus Parcubacteria bacterium]